MTTEVTPQPRHLAIAVAVLLGALGLVAWWSSPAPAQPSAGPAPAPTYSFVARADNPVDALAASSVAGQLGAPVYLTFPANLDEQAAQGLSATDPDVVVLAGGTAALSDTVKEQIEQLLPDATIVRKAGFGRTETARLVNELTVELGIYRPVLAGATVAGDVGIDGTLTVAGTDVAAALQALSARVDALEADLTAADDRIASLEATLAGVTRDGSTLTFSGMNVQVVNGNGSTGATNGLGNLIVGYNEDYSDTGCKPSPSNCQYHGDGTADPRSGSHNLIIGVDHTYSSYGGLVTGRNNTISGKFASVTGGERNAAPGNYASVSGGAGNTASGNWASVSGGVANTASGGVASVSGGLGNTASGHWASVSGGANNTASADYASVAGGRGGIVADAYDSRIGNSDFPDS